MIATATDASLPNLSPWIDGLPNICGCEDQVQAIATQDKPVFLPNTNIKIENVKAAFAIALHMHQPTIPAGANGELISNLQ